MITNKQIVDNLNLTGNFLESSVFADLNSHQHFIATAEWPFSQPTFNGSAGIVALNHIIADDGH